MKIINFKGVLYKALLSMLSITVLTACGGGSDTPPPAPPVNNAPTAVADTIQGDEDTTFNGQLVGQDVDNDTLNYQLVSNASNGDVTVSSNGAFAYTPSENFNGSDSFEFLVNDGQANSSPATIDISINSINDIPVIENSNFSVNEDSSLSEQVQSLDVDNDNLTLEIVSPASNGDITFNETSFVYTPASDFFGSDSFEFRVSDGITVSEVGVITIDVLSINDAPVAGASEFTTAEDSILSNTLIASDVEDDSLSYTLVEQATFGTVEIDQNGMFVYTPNPNYFGQDDFEFLVNDGQDDSVVTTASIEIAAVNDAPVASAASFNTLEDSVLSNNLSAIDIDSENLTYTVQRATTFGSIEINPDGTFVYMPNPNYFGEDSFSFIVTDGNLDSEEAMVTINVDSINDLPVVQQQSFTFIEDETLDYIIVASDIESPNLSFTITQEPQNGTISIVFDTGMFIYAPNENYNGSDSFVVAVNDGMDVVQQTMLIDVTPVNDAPLISGSPADSITAFEMYDFTPTASDVDTGDTLTFSVINLPAWASFNESTGQVSGLPENDSIGTYRDIAISVSDGIETTDLTSFSIVVIGVPWIELTSLQSSVHGHAAAQIDGKTYILGGSSGASLVYDISMEEIDVITPMLEEKRLHSAHSIQGMVYVFGGDAVSGTTNAVEIYDPNFNTWTLASTMQNRRSSHASCSKDDMVYVFGGFTNILHSNATSTSEVYDSELDIWTQLAPMPIANWGMSCAISGTNIFVFGGANNANSYFIYDILNNSWMSGGSMPRNRRFGFRVEEMNEKIYLIGGYTNSNVVLRNVDEYDPILDIWVEKTSMDTARYDYATVVFENGIYTFGGRNNEVDGLSIVESYTPSYDPVE